MTCRFLRSWLVVTIPADYRFAGSIRPAFISECQQLSKSLQSSQLELFSYRSPIKPEGRASNQRRGLTVSPKNGWEQDSRSDCRRHLSPIRRFAFAKYKDLADTSIELVSASHQVQAALRGLSMQVNIKRCRTSIRAVMGIVFLALAVFGWGVKYKISLYDPPGSISTICPRQSFFLKRSGPFRPSI